MINMTDCNFIIVEEISKLLYFVIGVVVGIVVRDLFVRTRK